MTTAPLRALTVRQPWATCIASGAKTVENRTRPTRHRGRLAIHAGLTGDMALSLPHVNDAVFGMNLWFDPLPRGAIVAVVDVVGCHWADTSLDGKVCCCVPWGQPEQYHWELANAQPAPEPVPARGALGLWRVPADVACALGRWAGAGSDR